MNFINYLQQNPAIFATIIGVLSLAIGSFLNVVIHRLPIMLHQEWRNECEEFLGKTATQPESKFNLALPGSHCPACKHAIKILYNIPVISYLLLGGKCAYCRTKIPARYPLVELLTCLISVFVALHYGATYEAIVILFLTWVLIVLMFIDLTHLILPDIIVIPMLWFGLLLNTQNMFCSPQQAIIGAITGYLSLWLIAKLFKIIRGIEGMGHGDFKLLAMFGAWLGWIYLPLIIFAASFLGALIGITLVLLKRHSMRKPLPFGPFLAFASWIAILWGQDIFNWYLRIMGL